MCGQNHRGQLGLGHNADITTLQLCPRLSQRVTEVACGWDFTLFLTGEHHFTPGCDALLNTNTVLSMDIGRLIGYWHFPLKILLL